VDHTPIPAGCNKTYNIAYATDRASAIYDVIPTIDGGRLAVGGLGIPTTYQSPQSDGLIIKYQSNGDVAWARNYNLGSAYDLDFFRVVMLADGNMLAIGNLDYDYDYGFYQDIVLMKFDINGNVIWTNTIFSAQMSDIGATPDGGFILLSGATVIRYDANANIVWQRYTTHAADIPAYLSVFCSGNNVDIAFHSQTFPNQFGVDRLNLQTGAEVWSKAYTTSSTSNSVNKIISIRDSVYLFMYNYIQYAAAPVTNLVIQLDTLGNFYQAQTFGSTDALNVTINPPTVTLTSDGNFALASLIATSNSLLLTKLQPNGTVQWSNNFASIPYMPMNFHTQGKGFIIPGIQSVLHTGNPNFINSILLKMDSSGQFEEGAAAGCQATPHSFIVIPYTSVGPISNSLSSDLPTTVSVASGSMYVQNAAVSPTLLCYAPGNCNSVNMLQKGAACVAGDTLVYYLDHSGNCGAAATWNYDPTLFRPGLISGDSIQLIVQQGGSSTVSAQIEGYCSLTLPSIAANITLTTSNLGLGPDTVVCDNASVTLTVSPGFASYLWSDNSAGTSDVVTAPGKYFVTATDQCGGLHSDTVLVTAADSLFHLTPDTMTCNQDTVILQASSGYTDYQWAPAYDIQAQGSKALVTPGITTRYIVTALRRPGCTVTRSALVTALSSPAIALGSDTSICFGDSLLLDAGPLFNSYQWSTGASGENIYISQAGAYSVAALYSNGCSSKDSFQLVSLYRVTQPSLDQDSILCLGTDRLLNAGPGYAAYLWSNGSTGSSLDISQPGVYWVTVTDNHGCKVADSTHVTMTAAPPTGFLPADTSVCQYGNTVISTLQPFVSYSWSDLSTGPSLAVNEPGIYWVTVTDANGCFGKDSIIVTGKECLIGLFVPNAFTPNGDGRNDRFRPLFYGNASNFEFVVFNRWGQRVFETKSPSSDGWDGTVNGVAFPAGVYVWYCRYQSDGQPETMQKGTVILVR
jgi:gliding motility-associated-like protein